jgi:hypothetical protein
MSLFCSSKVDVMIRYCFHALQATGEEDDSEVADSDIVDEICHKCKGGEKPEKMLLCDVCDRGWHIYCLNPPLRDIPQGDWSCPKCVAKCTKVQQESDPKGWLNQTAAECQVSDCSSFSLVATPFSLLLIPLLCSQCCSPETLDPRYDKG